MDSEYIDEMNEPKKKSSSVTKNVLISVAIILAVSVIILVGTGEIGGAPYSYLAGLFFAIIAFPALSILTGIGFLIAAKQREGGIMLLIGFSFLLFGLIVCGGLLT